MTATFTSHDRSPNVMILIGIKRIFRTGLTRSMRMVSKNPEKRSVSKFPPASKKGRI
jgi:hypothetical protein